MKFKESTRARELNSVIERANRGWSLRDNVSAHAEAREYLEGINFADPDFVGEVNAAAVHNNDPFEIDPVSIEHGQYGHMAMVKALRSAAYTQFLGITRRYMRGMELRAPETWKEFSKRAFKTEWSLGSAAVFGTTEYVGMTGQLFMHIDVDTPEENIRQQVLDGLHIPSEVPGVKDVDLIAGLADDIKAMLVAGYLNRPYYLQQIDANGQITYPVSGIIQTGQSYLRQHQDLH